MIILSKMSKNLFDLVHDNNDWREHYFFDGPPEATLDDFQKLCNELLPKAAFKATLKTPEPPDENWIGWDDIVKAMIPLLKEQGYQRVFIDTCQIDGSGILGLYTVQPPEERLGFAGPLIFKHNQEIKKRLAKEREAKRALKGYHLKKKAIQIIK